MRKIVLILCLSFSFISCSQKNIPYGLRSTINEIDRNLNDTVKYDFKIAPEGVATSKHHFGLGLNIRNEKNLWRSSLLKTFFQLNGIQHPDDMSGIILTTYHRELNNKPINFREQKRYYKEYWKIAQLPGDTIEKWYAAKNPEAIYQKENEAYLSNFTIGRKVLGSVNAWKEREREWMVRFLCKFYSRNYR
ncbi:DUF6794 domain-containing protein [Salinimicrobium xinjiangense]|uniref:DUF6794 domain-containing protein n=1 Tax=Salinimicrobium xinjiangense TaxID=438596 RepID=UPI0004294373|nr:DUF6794 domain-containing protein [Salinimicrobium xinjiangense]